MQFPPTFSYSCEDYRPPPTLSQISATTTMCCTGYENTVPLLKLLMSLHLRMSWAMWLSIDNILCLRMLPAIYTPAFQSWRRVRLSCCLSQAAVKCRTIDFCFWQINLTSLPSNLSYYSNKPVFPFKEEVAWWGFQEERQRWRYLFNQEASSKFTKHHQEWEGAN